MKAMLLLHERQLTKPQAFVEIKVWRVPTPVRGSKHQFKYSLAYVVEGVCVLRYDNEAGKGDHKHIDGVEYEYSYQTNQKLLQDFWSDVDEWEDK